MDRSTYRLIGPQTDQKPPRPIRICLDRSRELWIGLLTDPQRCRFIFCCFSAISDSSDLTICCKLFELQVAGVVPMLNFKLSFIRIIRPSALSAVFHCKWRNWSVNVHWLRSVGNSFTLAYWFELRDTSEDHGWYWCEFRELDEEEE